MTQEKPDKPEGADTDLVDDEGEQEQQQEGAGQLGDAGKKALDAMKAKWQKAREDRNALAAKLAALEKPAETAEDGKPDLEAVRKQARHEAAAELLRDRVLDKIEAKAARLFADPEDAVALLGRKADDFIDDGKVDADAITEALADLLKRKPHLGLAAQGGGRRFEGGADGGARKGSGPAQLTEEDLKRMTPEQIVEAQKKGQLATLLGAP